MVNPKGRLTDVQLEIMEVFWGGPPEGLKPSDVWMILGDKRDVARTTILTLLNRLEHRGWIERASDSKGVIYRATVSEEEASSHQAASFLDEYFEGSATRLISSLLGSGRVTKSELTRLRKLLNKRQKGG